MIVFSVEYFALDLNVDDEVMSSMHRHVHEMEHFSREGTDVLDLDDQPGILTQVFKGSVR